MFLSMSLSKGYEHDLNKVKYRFRVDHSTSPTELDLCCNFQVKQMKFGDSMCE